MFKFLFGKKGGSVVQESQRQTVERALEDLNAVLVQMAHKPEVRIDLNSGAIRLELPEQMPDEALALPAPEEKAVVPEGEAETTPQAEKTAA